MALILREDDVRAVLTMGDTMRVLEAAFRRQAAGEARNQPRRRVVLPDGLRLVGGNVFLMIEGDGHLDRVTLNGDTATVDTIRDGFAGPTGVTVVGNTAWVTEGQLSFLMDPSKKGQQPNLPFRVHAVPLSAK